MKRIRYFYLSMVYYLYLVNENITGLFYDLEYFCQNGKWAKRTTKEEGDRIKKLLNDNKCD